MATINQKIWRKNQIKAGADDLEMRRFLLARRLRIKNYLRLRQIDVEPLSVWFPPLDISPTVFPIPTYNGKRFPRWSSLSESMKCFALLLMMNEYPVQTFTVNIHPKWEDLMIRRGDDPAHKTRTRFNKKLKRVFGTSRICYAFVIESKAKDPRIRQTHLHLHGFILWDRLVEIAGDQKAAAKAFREVLMFAGGQNAHGNTPVDRAPHMKLLSPSHTPYGSSPAELAWSNYLFKLIQSPDSRISLKRFKMSEEATQIGADFWHHITDRENLMKWL